MRNTEQDNLKYQKLYHWAHTLITSGVIKNMDKFPSETILQKKFGYSRQTVRTALQQLEDEGLITRVRGSGTYVSYEGSTENESRQRVGLLLSYYSDYLFPQVYDGIESALTEKGYGIEVAVTKNRLNDEALYLEGLIKSNVSGLIIEGSRSAFPNPNIRLFREIRKRNIPTLFIHNHYENQLFDSVEMEDARAAYELTKILIEHGHRRIGGIFKYDDMQGIERYKGFIQCLSDYGVKFDDDCVRWYSTKDMDEKLSKKGMLRMYRRTKDCTAMIVYNDEVAGYYMEFLADRGLSVPEDVSVVSFDDAELQQEQKVKLLSAVHPKYQLGRITAKNLLRMMEDENWQERNYSYRFLQTLQKLQKLAIAEANTENVSAYAYENVLGINITGTETEKIACSGNVENYSSGEKYGVVWRRVRGRAVNRKELLALYGGFFFLGIFLGTVFLAVTVMIIFYKQVSEGYEDKERYRIMEQVGMSNVEVKSAIETQIRMVFFLPIVVAVLHVVAAFPMIRRVLSLLIMDSGQLFVWCLVTTVLVFAVIYYVVFRITSKIYYRIVGNQVR